MKALLCLVSILTLILVACGPAETPEVPAADIVQAAPDNVELLLDNEYVTVMRFTVPSQTRLPLHHAEARLVYSLNGYKVRTEVPGYDPTINDFREGDVRWYSAGDYALSNVAATTARFVVVTSKGPNPTPGVTSNLAELDPEHGTVILERQNAKVISVTLEPGAKLPEHNAAARVIYSLTPAKIRMISDGEVSEADYAEGDVHWHMGGPHTVESLSEEPIRYIVFELM